MLTAEQLEQVMNGTLQGKVTDPDGNTFYFKDGRYHRTTGPAIIWNTGTTEWYYEGKPIQPAQQYPETIVTDVLLTGLQRLPRGTRLLYAVKYDSIMMSLITEYLELTTSNVAGTAVEERIYDILNTMDQLDLIISALKEKS